MIHVAIRVRDLVSSNVDNLVSKAGDRHKMLRLLQTEIEETLIALHGDLTRAGRAQERLLASARKLEDGADGWTAKAQVALDHGREDLARAALLAREGDRARAAADQQEADKLAEQIDETKGIVAELEAKRAAVAAQLVELARSATGPTANAASPNRTDRRIDRIEELDRRAGFTAPAEQEPGPGAIDAEIAALQRASAIDAELAAMKAPAPVGKGGRKAKR